MHSCYFAINAILLLLNYIVVLVYMHSCYFAINAILLLLYIIVVICTPAILLLMLFCYYYNNE